MILVFERKVEEKYLCLDKTSSDGKMNREIDSSPNGYYPVIIVPIYLIGKKL